MANEEVAGTLAGAEEPPEPDPQLYPGPCAVYGALVSLLGASEVLSAAGLSISRGLFCLDRADLDFAVYLTLPALSAAPVRNLARSWGVLGAASALLAAQVFSAALRILAPVIATSWVPEECPSP